MVVGALVDKLFVAQLARELWKSRVRVLMLAQLELGRAALVAEGAEERILARVTHHVIE